MVVGKGKLMMFLQYSWVPSVFDGYGAALPWDEVRSDGMSGTRVD